MLKSDGMTGVPYDFLSPIEFANGFTTRALEDEFEDESRDMFRYYRDLMADAKEPGTPWHVVRSFHAYFLIKLERGEITWKSKKKINDLKLRLLYAKRILVNTEEHTTPNSAPSSQRERPTPCPAYQTGNCGKPDTHDGMRHICEKCLREKDRSIVHPYIRCWGVTGYNNNR